MTNHKPYYYTAGVQPDVTAFLTMIRDLLDSTNIYGYKILNTLPRSVTNVCNWSMLVVVW